LRRGGGIAVAVPTCLYMWACGDDDDGGGSADAGAGSFTVSSAMNQHTHQITVQCADLARSSAVTYSSTRADGHTHTVTISAAELAMITAGQTVTITTADGGHTHTWQINKGSKCG
jgi:hypothetical protein